MGYDVLVLGGGSAGCVLAARLSEDERRTVCLVEGGPDYGPYAAGRWPVELLDAGGVPESHQWDADESPYTPLRARVLGGCSSHNACLLVRAPAADYDGWGDGWTSADLDPYLDRAFATIAPRPFTYAPDDFSPWFAGVVEAAAAEGLPLLPDINDPPEALGVGIGPFNVVGGNVRWNAAFAYLDPSRDRPNLTILADTVVDRVLVKGGRAVGATAGAQTIEADAVVVCAGAFGSPAILLRSGIGPEDDLRALGIGVTAPLAEVGANLSEHATAKLQFEATDALRAETAPQAPVDFSHGVIKAATDASGGELDAHLLPVTSRTGDGAHLTVALMRPESRGSVRLRSADPSVAPEIRHGLLSDAGGGDRGTLRAGLRLARRLADSDALRRLGRPLPFPDDDARIDATLGIYFHPVGTCALGSVTDREARVRGFENLHVADASVMPTVPRANTHLTTLAIAEKVAEVL